MLPLPIKIILHLEEKYNKKAKIAFWKRLFLF